MQHEIVAFTPADASREQWRLLHDFRRNWHTETRPDDPFDPDDVFEKSLLHKDPFSETVRWLSLAKGEPVGYLRISRHTPASPEYESNKHLVRASGEILPVFRRQGLGTTFAKMLHDLMEDWNTHVSTAWTDEEDGHSFLKALGAGAKYTEADNRLDLADVDWELMQSWVDDAATRSPGTKVLIFENRFPGELLEEYLPVYTEIHNDMPLEDLDKGAQIYDASRWSEINDWFTQVGAAHHTCIARDPDGQISALTDVVYQPATPRFIQQWATGVPKHHRGRGLGKAVKATMLLRLKELYPDARFILTGNANSNDPMLSINHAMGFRKHRDWVGYQFSSETLGQWLASRQS
ncbi:MAG TPA: hypothetical protein VNA87_00885 [Actinomycetota bacterium]|nr:hypothetical protein [Actinomycetota bacterium]